MNFEQMFTAILLEEITANVLFGHLLYMKLTSFCLYYLTTSINLLSNHV